MLKTEAPQRAIEHRRHLERLLAGQKRILEMIALDEPLTATLDAITSLIEAQSSAIICSIMVASDDGRTLNCASGGRLPAEYAAALKGIPVGPDTGSCGTAAALKQRVITSDIATDPKWQGYAELANRNGLYACWSQPVLDSQGEVLGTFAIYYNEPSEPTEEHFELIEVASHLVEICLARARARSRRQQLLARAANTLAEVNSRPGLSQDIRSALSSVETQLRLV